MPASALGLPIFLAISLAAASASAQRSAGPAPGRSDGLPQLPGQSPTPDGASADPAAPRETPADTDIAPAGSPAPAPPPQGVDVRKLYEHLRKGVVAVERNGVPAAIGTVLGGDGRVLTALSSLGGADTVVVRYADGTAVHAKVGESDTALDLALLVPKSIKSTDGLTASEADPTGTILRAMLPAAGKIAGLGPAVAGVKGPAEAHARDGQPLLNLLDVDLKGPAIAGAPLVDANGGVVAVLVRACKGTGAEAGDPFAGAVANCVPVVVGAPVAAVRSFLSHAPTAPVAPAAPAPWLGIRGEAESSGSVRGVRVTAVAPSSPAEKAGLKPSSDVIAAVDGKPVDSPERLAEAISRHAPGETVKLLVYGGEKFRELSVLLRTAP